MNQSGYKKKGSRKNALGNMHQEIYMPPGKMSPEIFPPRDYAPSHLKINPSENCP